MACSVKKISGLLTMGARLTVLTGLAVVCACSPKPQAAQDPDAYLRAAGYSPTPQILSVTGSGNTVTITGQALPGGRVRILYGDQRATGVTADAKGRFSADVPLQPGGGLYDVSMDDAGRMMQAEGRLFIPPGAPQRAILLRGGAPSVALSPKTEPGVAVIDYDAAGAMIVTGKAAAGAAIVVTIDNESWPKQPPAGADGLFVAVCQFLPPQADAAPINVTVTAGQQTWNRVISVSTPPATDRITAVDSGWRVDWKVPGGGMQTAMVF